MTRNSIKSSGFFSETVDEWISFVALLLDAFYSFIIGIILLIPKIKNKMIAKNERVKIESKKIKVAFKMFLRIILITKIPG
jgi:hypothetical protein